MFLFKVIAASAVVVGVAVAFTGLLLAGRQQVNHAFDEKIMDDMADPPWWV